MLLGALSVGAQEKPVTAADYKQKVLEYSRQIKQRIGDWWGWRISRFPICTNTEKNSDYTLSSRLSISPAATSTVSISTIWISAPAWLSKWIITPIVWELP